jgi:hypothetical protein
MAHDGPRIPEGPRRHPDGCFSPCLGAPQRNPVGASDRGPAPPPNPNPSPPGSTAIAILPGGRGWGGGGQAPGGLEHMKPEDLLQALDNVATDGPPDGTRRSDGPPDGTRTVVLHHARFLYMYKGASKSTAKQKHVTTVLLAPQP